MNNDDTELAIIMLGVFVLMVAIHYWVVTDERITDDRTDLVYLTLLGTVLALFLVILCL